MTRKASHGEVGESSIRAGLIIPTDFPITVRKLLVWLNGKDADGKAVGNDAGLKFKTVEIDTLNGIMVAEEMRNAKVQGYGKWTDLASYNHDILDYLLSMRNDITVLLVVHSETISDDNGMVFTRIKTNGRKLEKIVVESKLNTVLLAECKDGKVYLPHTRREDLPQRLRLEHSAKMKLTMILPQ